MSQDEVNPETDADGYVQWDIAGYLDFNGNYHDFEEGQDIPTSNDWWSDVDLLTVGWTDADDGTYQYARLVGPFDDFDDVEDHVMDYFETGTP